MNNDKDVLEVLLNAFKLNQVDKEYVLKYILDKYSDSKRFNLFNFQIGMSAGVILMLIFNYFKLL